jgi:UDP-3-O-[3-hydroxymyristoyl] glucosamine N-acyltransferase
MDHVIEFTPWANYCWAKGSSIYCTIGPNLNIITDNYITQVVNFFVCYSSIDQAMVDVSKIFFTDFEKTTQCLLDGRQTGTVKIDPTVEIAQGVFIGEDVEIGSNCKILPGSVIMPKTVIGERVTIFPRVTIYPKTKIGNDVLIYSGSVSGSDGFGYAQLSDEHKKNLTFG